MVPYAPSTCARAFPGEDAELSALEAVRRALAGSGMEVMPVAVLSIEGEPLYMGHWSAGGSVPGYDEPDEAVGIPGRNVVLAGIAAIWATSRGISTVALGSLSGNPFPDASEDFLTDYARLLSASIGSSVRIEAPFRDATKAELIARYPDLPYELTLSCMAPLGGAHCQACNKCRERAEAFAEVGVPGSRHCYSREPGVSKAGRDGDDADTGRRVERACAAAEEGARRTR